MAVILMTGCLTFGQAQEKTESEAKAAKLSAATLPAFLKEMGLKLEIHKPGQGEPVCSFEVNEKDGWNFVVDVSITEGSLWLACPLGDQLAEGESPSSAFLLSVLEANQATAPCFFTYQSKTGTLLMKLEIPNLTLTVEDLRAEMKTLFDMVRQSHVLWKDENRRKAGAEVAKKDAMANTFWVGRENLQNYGVLAFYFLPEGKVVMVDQDGDRLGSYTKMGQNLTLTFMTENGPVTYHGSSNGETFSGTARDKNGQRAWSFSVQR